MDDLVHVFLEQRLRRFDETARVLLTERTLRAYVRPHQATDRTGLRAIAVVDRGRSTRPLGRTGWLGMLRHGLHDGLLGVPTERRGDNLLANSRAAVLHDDGGVVQSGQILDENGRRLPGGRSQRLVGRVPCDYDGTGCGRM